ncbi:MAG: DNA mismatch repair endonuclease MutL [Clostridiales bacterium]|nr:DNA mismatch repair endonuclease MutL [Clostridiales bacterium]
MSIKLLDKQVINQIAAGEVVEKPASIVKELVENSIDAGATEITIEIKNGGIDYISITDNGCGINKDEVVLAFTPHATSKLEKINDLNSLTTMGFRGEALASISAISKVTMVTKTNQQDTGIKVELEGGEILHSNEVACVTGTKIEVKEIFYNTPPRLKFLRKPKTEENDITSYVEKLILCNEHISFKYIINDKIIYNTISGNIMNNLYSIYGKELAENMLPVKYNIGEYFVSGFVSKPEFSKANRSYQNLFVNNRFCNNALISTAVSNAYENFTMKGKFPVYTLFLHLPQDQLDVNVHPNKLEVKFENTQLVYRVFNDAVFKTLSDFNHVRTINEKEVHESTFVPPLIKEPITNINKNEGISFSHNNIAEDAVLEKYQKHIVDTNKNRGSFHFELTDNILPQVDIVESDIKLVETKNNTPIKKFEQTDFKKVLNIEYNYIGKVFNTYLIIEHDDKLFLIDQHAAHERQNYDSIMKQLNDNNLKIQDLLIPYTFKTSQAEAAFLDNNLSILREFGIEISEFGYNSFRVSSVPLLIADIDLKIFFDEILDNLSSMVKSPQGILKNRFMQMACKAAVKGGDSLSDSEIKNLLNKLKNETDVLLCPHGRPIIVEITKKQIEKWFKRIV